MVLNKQTNTLKLHISFKYKYQGKTGLSVTTEQSHSISHSVSLHMAGKKSKNCLINILPA